jgi:hypothetical protein
MSDTPTPGQGAYAVSQALALCGALSLEMACCTCGEDPAGPPCCVRCECLIAITGAAYSYAMQQEETQ